MVMDAGQGGEGVSLHPLSAPGPYPRKDQWESWRARLQDPRHPPNFARGRERQVPDADQRDIERSEICNAALWLMYNDSARRAYSENDFASAEWERVVRPLNFQNSKIAELLKYLAKEELTTVEPRNEMAQTVKYYWHDQAKLCEDIMFYLLRRDVYLASFYAWFNESMNSIPNADGSFIELIVSFVGDLLVGPVWQDPIRQLGLSMRATLPLHPIVRNASRR